MLGTTTSIASEGGGVTAFAFNSELEKIQAKLVEISQDRQWALVDSVGVSSAFFAQKINEIFNDIRKDERLLEKYLDDYRDDINRLIRKLFPGSSLVDRLVGIFDRVFYRVDNVVDKVIEREGGFAKILNEIDDLVPEYRYWSVVDNQPGQLLKNDNFADGGNLENTGVASLLTYQDIDNLIAFVNTSTPMTAGNLGVFDENGNEIPNTRIIVDSQVPVLFGYQPHKLGEGYRLYKGSDAPDSPEFQFNQVFESSAFADFLIKIWAASGNESNPGSNQRPATCSQNLRVLENHWFGAKGRGGPGEAQGNINIAWYYNNASTDWVNSLNAEVQNLLGDPNVSGSYPDFNDFPHYSTFSSHLTKQEINLLANYTAWAVADPSNSAVFTEMFQDE